MTGGRASVEVYVELGSRRAFAGGIEWPGWSRSGRDEASALEALAASSPRYARVLRGTRLGFRPVDGVDTLSVVERLTGDATTDFGAPSIATSADLRPFDDAGMRRSRTILTSCWRSFDAAVEQASGRELRKGPRGGGRELGAILRHVMEADGAYLAKLARKRDAVDRGDHATELDVTREAIVGALEAAVRGEIPERGPRGGTIWPPRYFVRRVAWHVLDHTWEIEDRSA
jgi:hypothetical protein